MTLVAVSDAGPLIHLAEIDSLDFPSAFDALVIPRTVYRELEEGGVPEGLSEVDHDLVTAEGDPSVTAELDPGETAALAVANERDAILLTDDFAAREAATAADVEVHGSLGIIALGYARGTLAREEAASLMRALQRETSLFVTDAVVERGIDLLDDR
ncbi:nucleic acid-binding protein [Halomarina halobia]|uniref:Nucleic acid-binding protein n=1 Tax=Halomarina halobia TaxID=3033386 RepID=A0ABD6AE00_9EURY|nr:nucleic acid-binding protein [Halomarina sp. PSR21]